jgi:hypothetical protein
VGVVSTVMYGYFGNCLGLVEGGGACLYYVILGTCGAGNQLDLDHCWR